MTTPREERIRLALNDAEDAFWEQFAIHFQLGADLTAPYAQPLRMAMAKAALAWARENIPDDAAVSVEPLP